MMAQQNGELALGQMDALEYIVAPSACVEALSSCPEVLDSWTARGWWNNDGSMCCRLTTSGNPGDGKHAPFQWWTVDNWDTDTHTVQVDVPAVFDHHQSSPDVDPPNSAEKRFEKVVRYNLRFLTPSSAPAHRRKALGAFDAGWATLPAASILNIPSSVATLGQKSFAPVMSLNAHLTNVTFAPRVPGKDPVIVFVSPLAFKDAATEVHTTFPPALQTLFENTVAGDKRAGLPPILDDLTAKISTSGDCKSRDSTTGAFDDGSDADTCKTQSLAWQVEHTNSGCPAATQTFQAPTDTVCRQKCEYLLATDTTFGAAGNTLTFHSFDEGTKACACLCNLPDCDYRWEPRYDRMPGNGWCRNAEGQEGTARYFRSDKQQHEIEHMCDEDEDCVAYAAKYDGANTFVVYTTTDPPCCTLYNEENNSWQNDRTSITQAGGNTAWGSGECFVKPLRSAGDTCTYNNDCESGVCANNQICAAGA